MTDLDRKIAELKGWQYHKDKYLGEGFAHSENPFGEIFLSGREWWSQDIAKAFELVDEVSYEQNNRINLYDFYLGISCRSPFRWRAYFIGGASILMTGRHTTSGRRKTFEAEASTRPEAICRAYIALKEWEAKK